FSIHSPRPPLFSTLSLHDALPISFFLIVWGLTTHGKYSASGDEPHYLIVAESLAADGDLDLSNNYAEDDGRLFGHAGLMNDGHRSEERRVGKECGAQGWR